MLSLYMYLSTRKIWSSRVQVAVLSDCCSCPTEWSRSSASAALMEATVACVRRWWHAAVKATMPHLDKSLIHSLHCMPLNFMFQEDWGKTKWNKLQNAEVERKYSWQLSRQSITNQPPPALKRESFIALDSQLNRPQPSYVHKVLHPIYQSACFQQEFWE